MPKLGPKDSKEAKQERVSEEMGKFKRGTLRSGSKTGPEVTDRKQAVAIALSEAGLSKNRKKGRSRTRSSGRR